MIAAGAMARPLSRTRVSAVRRAKNRAFTAALWACGFLAVLPLVFIAAYVIARGVTALNLSFFTRALRLSIAVIAMIAIYLPLFATNRGATLGLLASTITTSVWYLLGNPYGIDNMYVALVTPAIVVVIERLFPQSAAKAAPAEVPHANH